MKPQNLIFAVLFFPATVFASNIMEQPGFPNTLKGKDFFVIQTKEKTSRVQRNQMLATTDCRAHIAKVVCLVDPVTDREDPTPRKCLDGGEKYALPFQQIHDSSPPMFQKMFCSLERIYIEKQFFGTAYAGTMKDADGNQIGAVMGVRKSVLDESLGLEHWASWKEQLSFGGVSDSYIVMNVLPQVETKTAGKVSDFLYFLVAHEFGHIFDFANGVNATVDCPEPAPGEDWKECNFAEGSWGSISWATTMRPKPANDYAHRTELCFYMCEGKFIAESSVLALYEGMSKSDFISTYASVQAWDDFADSLAYYLMSENLGTSYLIETRQGPTYDVMAKLRSPLFKKKREYIREFLERDGIVYP